MSDTVYFVNSQGRKVILSSPDNDQYWELRGRYGFTAPEVDLFSQTFASGRTRYFGKTVKPRTCGMNMVVTGRNRAERDKVFFEMLDVLLDVNGTGEGELHLKRSDGTPVVLHCVYSSGMRIAEEYKKLYMFTIEFYAADPMFYWEQKHPFSSFIGGMTIHNPFNENLWPELYCGTSPAGSSGTQTMISNQDTQKSINFYVVTVNSHNVTYTDIYAYTKEAERGIYGTKAYIGPYAEEITLHNAVIPELVGGDLDVLNFPLIPGDNTLSWTYFWSYATSYIVVRKPFAGA